jgi:hypothetical protein
MNSTIRSCDIVTVANHTLLQQVKRLTIFQNHCLRSSSGTYKFDRWMVKFLIQHASSLEEKHDNVDAAVVDNELQTSLGIDELQLERSRVTYSIIRDI